MGRRRRACAVAGVLFFTVVMAGCPSRPAPSPAPERSAPARSADVAPVSSGLSPAAPPATPDDVVRRVLEEAPLAPTFHALALAFDVDPRTKVDVSLDGEATLFEVDLPDGPVPLRRARSLGPSTGRGLFGRGWRSELDSRVVPVGEGALVVRLQGVTPFVPLEGDVLVSLAGEVELLRRAEAGWELAAADGRVLSFDPDGLLSRLSPGFEVERAVDRITLVGDDGARVVLRLDAAGRVARVEHGGGALAFAHDARGELVAAGERRYVVDAAGRLVRAGKLVVERGHDDRVARLATEDGRERRYAFGDDRAEVTSPAGRFVYRAVDDGLVVETPRGEDRAWLDARGRLVAFRRAGDEARVVARDDLGRPVIDDDAPAPGEDAARALGLRIERDADGRLAAVVTPAGRRWRFAWEGARLVATDGPAGPVELARDARGHVTARRDASGRLLLYERDALGRPLAVGASSGEQVVWVRDDEGALVALEASDAAGATTRIEVRRTRDGAFAVRQPGGVTLVHAEEPRADHVLTPWGRFVTRYDEQGRATSLDTPAGTFRFTHDEAGRRVVTEYPRGLVVERERDAAGRVVRQVARHDGRALSTVEAAWDERGRPASVTRDGAVTRYAHDALGRLVRLERQGGAAAWSWNEDADRTAEVRGGARREARFDARGRIVSRAGPDLRERFVHDAAGRLVERVLEDARGGVVGRDRFAYDGFGRLVRVERAGRPAVEVSYDPLGRVLTRTVGGATTRRVYDGERLLAEVGPGARERVFVWGPSDDEPLAWCEREGAGAPWRWRFVVSSDLHTSLVHVDEAGRVVATDDLDPWGAGEVGVDHPVFFAGHLADPIAGLVPMRARWYDPSLGRFLTPDPAGLAGGPNAYAYVSGRPLDRVDPLGLEEAPREEPGALARFGRWLGGQVAQAHDTVVGAVEGMGYLAGLHGTPQQRAAARGAALRDLTSGRAASRALGAVDGYVQGVTFGLVDPGASRFAYDAEHVRRGRAYGDAGALVFGVASARGALVDGVRALPGAARALPDVVRAAPGALRAAPGALARGVRAAPGAVGDGVRWLAANRAALARGARDLVAEQARGAYRVTVGPFVSLGRALLRPVRGASPGLARAGGAARASRLGAAALADDLLAVDDGARAAGIVGDAAKAGADDLARAGAANAPAVESQGFVRALGDESAGVARRGPGGPAHGPREAWSGPPGGAPRVAPTPVRPGRLVAAVEQGGARAIDPRTGNVVGEGALVGDGLLTLYVNVPKAGLPQQQGYGREAIMAIHDALVASGQEVRGIEACWLALDDIADNLRAFEAGLARGLTIEEAALATPTGRAAQALGYGRVEPGSFAPVHGGSGRLVSVAITFVR